MALADDVRALRDRTLAELTAAHDYFEDTRNAWDLVEKAVNEGETFAFHNPVTGTATSQADLVSRGRRYVKEQLAEASFQQFISIFESFLFDLLRLWLSAYPQSLAKKRVEVQTILDAPDRDALLYEIVGREFNERAYDRPAEWFRYLEERANLGHPAPDEIERIAEAKATRDVLVHNRGVANRIYETKAGRLARYASGERIDVTESYHRQVWSLLRKVVAEVSDAAIAKGA